MLRKAIGCDTRAKILQAYYGSKLEVNTFSDYMRALTQCSIVPLISLLCLPFRAFSDVSTKTSKT